MAAPLRSTSPASRAPRRSVAPRSGAQRAAATSRRPALRVVRRRRRWPVVFGAIALVVVIAGMLGAAVFHTQLAQRQLEIDRLERGVDAERERFDELRRDRAALRSPQRIADEADRLGMVRGETSEFIQIEVADLARQLAAAGVVDDGGHTIIDTDDPLQQFRDVKAVSAGQP